MEGADILIALLQVYFMLMNVTVERTYCHTPIKRGDTGFLVAETVDVRRLIDMCLSRRRTHLLDSQRPPPRVAARAGAPIFSTASGHRHASPPSATA